MLVFGVIISGNISESVMEKNQEYNTAIQINNDKDLFEYGMRTNVGNAFVYGELKAVDTVSYDEIPGEYSYVKKVTEKYTMHTRTVTKTRTVNGKTQTYTEVETYWTWDEIAREDKHSKKISFLNVEFDYGTIKFPSANRIDTIKQSSHIRHVYYGTGTEFHGTLYTKLGENTISDPSFYNNSTIEETIEYLESHWQVPLFWVGWIILTSAIVVGFYYIDNRWLEDKKYRAW